MSRFSQEDSVQYTRSIQNYLTLFFVGIVLAGCAVDPGFTDSTDNAATGEDVASSGQALSDSWSKHFNCNGANNAGYSPPTMQVHYHEWTSLPWTSALRGIDGYAYYVYNPNFRVKAVNIRVYDEANPQGVLDHRTETYGGNGSMVSYFSPLLGVTRGEQLVTVELVSTKGDYCSGEVEL